MKKLLLTLLGMTMILTLMAQYPHGGGKLKAIVDGFSVILKDDTTARNCAAHYQMQIAITGSNPNFYHIKWIQNDIGWEAGCDCHFSYSVSLDSLENGHYLADVYFTEVHGGMPDPLPWGTPGIPYDTLYEGSVAFDILATTAHNPVKTDSTQSLCFPVYTDVVDLSTKHDGIGTCFPNPFQSVTNIPVHNHSDGDYLEIFNQFGVIKRIDLKMNNDIYKCDLSSYAAGLYFYRLHSNNYSSKVFRMVLIR